MRSLWNTTHASQCEHAAADPPDAPLALRAYSSRTLGAHKDLVLHGGGNTSYKNATTLYVKGSGADLAQVQPQHFTPLPLAATRALLDGPVLNNTAMFAALETLKPAGAPKPSIETLLHAALPHAWVEHTHADSVLAITNTAHATRWVQEVFGEIAVIVPYHHSGFGLARAVQAAVAAQARPGMLGVVLMQHGACAWGNSAKESYQNMLMLATRAEEALVARGAWHLALPEATAPLEDAHEKGIFEAICRKVRLHGRFEPVLAVRTHALARAAAAHPQAPKLFAQGPATPQHAIFCKRVQLVCDIDTVEQAIDQYAQDYAAYLGLRPDTSPLDPAPRIILLRGYGFVAISVDQTRAHMAAEMFEHDIEVMLRAQQLDRYASIPPALMLEAEVEYGGFEAPYRFTPSPH
jgi:rhamnose utilization protein RhaD (predicted bifunctional aldolase and dehydrogenase)